MKCAICNENQGVYSFKYLLKSLEERAKRLGVPLPIKGTNAHPECITKASKMLEKKEGGRGLWRSFPPQEDDYHVTN